MKKSTIILLIVIIAAAAVFLIVFITNMFARNSGLFNPSQTPSTVAAQIDLPTATPSQTTVLPATPTPTPTPSVTPTPSGATADSEVGYTDKQITYEYYDVVSDSNKEVSVPAPEGSQLKLALVVVSEEFFSVPLEESPINPVSIILSGNSVYIDFTSKIYSANLGSSGENSLLESIADAYLNNIPDLESVYISVEGKNYSSGHFEISKDKPYKVK